MQLKLKRTQRDSGVISKAVIFCLDARIEFTHAEAQDISRYKLANQMLYNSEASKRLLEKSAAQQDGCKHPVKAARVGVSRLPVS